MTAGVEREGLFPATCPDTIAGRALTVGWRSVGFVHWAFDPDAVARLLPPPVTLDLYGGRAWAGFQFVTVSPGRYRPAGTSPLDRLPWRPQVHLGPTCHEVRAVVMVVDRFGRPGLWFLSVDTNRTFVGAGLRRWFNLPAYEAECRFSRTDDHVDYWSHRPDGTAARLELTVGPSISATDVERFLAARWRVVLPPWRWDPPGETRAIATIHEPWRLHRATVELFDDEVLVSAGLPPAAGPAQALWSPGTTVRLGRPQRPS